MASAVLSSHGFPVGTSVGVWPAQNQVNGGPPSGSQVTSGTVAADQSLTLTGLAEKVQYVAWASALGRGVRFRADPTLDAALAPALSPLATRVRAVEELLTGVDTDARKWYAQPVTDDTNNLAAYIAANDDVQLRSGSYNVSAVNLNGLSGKRIRGAGMGVTNLVVTGGGLTGDVFTLVNASFCEFSDMLIRCSAQKTAGRLFYLDAGAGSCQRNRFERLRVASPYRGWELEDCTTTTLDEIQLLDTNASWSLDFLLKLSGAATSTNVDRLKGGTAAGGSASGVVWLANSSVDTFIASRWDLATQGGTSTDMLVINGGSIIKLLGCSIESGITKDGVTINGGRDIAITGGHILGRTGALLANGSALLNGVEFRSCQRNGVELNGGTDHQVIGCRFVDISLETNGYMGVSAAAGVSDFTVAENMIGRRDTGASTINSGVFVATGASDRYVIVGNRVKNYSANPVTDNGTGTHKAVANNVGV